MARGFIGNAAAFYFQGVENTLAQGNSVLSAVGGGTQRFETQTAAGGGYAIGIGTSQNIAIDEELYAEAFQRIEQNDQTLAEKLYYVIGEIRKMCEADFIIPDTVPRIESTIRPIEQSLSAFREVTDEATRVAKNFVIHVEAADRR